MYAFVLYQQGYTHVTKISPPPLLVAMNGAWHHCVLYTVANYSGMATRIQVFTELCVYLLKH